MPFCQKRTAAYNMANSKITINAPWKVSDHWPRSQVHLRIRNSSSVICVNFLYSGLKEVNNLMLTLLVTVSAKWAVVRVSAAARSMSKRSLYRAKTKLNAAYNTHQINTNRPSTQCRNHSTTKILSTN